MPASQLNAASERYSEQIEALDWHYPTAEGLLGGLALEASGAVLNCIGDVLPPAADEAARLEQVAGTSPNFGKIFSAMEASKTTGCWYDTNRTSRDPRGYFMASSRAAYDLGITRGSGTIRLHRLSYYGLKAESGVPVEELGLELDVDHICRSTACCNDNHLRAVTKEANNVLKLKADSLENAFAASQIYGPTTIDWLDAIVSDPSWDNISPYVISTRFGPYRLARTEADPRLVYAVPVADGLLDQLPQPAKSRSQRKYRLQKQLAARAIADQKSFDDKDEILARQIEMRQYEAIAA